jgi:FtsH-binding integral membrane protein
MRAILKTILGLVFDDWWLAGGLLISIVATYFLIDTGVDAEVSGWFLLLMIIAALILSLWFEYKKKSKRIG